MNIVSFNITKKDRALVDKIITRAAALDPQFDKLHHHMNLVATHANGCPMDFARLSEADDFNLSHDVFGIDQHIDRDTGKLRNCFLPRFAK